MAPTTAEAVPGGQVLQKEEPLLTEKVPEGQIKQEAELTEAVAGL